MVAIVVFLFPIGPRQSRPRWWSFDRGRSDRTRRAQRERLTAADGFFASRCKARHARRKKVGGGCCGKTIEAEPVFGQTQSIRGREVDGAGGNYLEYDRQQRHFANNDGSTVLAPKGLPLNGRGFDSVSWRHRGPLTPTFVVPSLVMPTMTGHRRGAIDSIVR